MEPQAPTMASQGLTRVAGAASTGRAPSLSSRMKQSCMLRNRVFLASLRSSPEKNRQTAIDRSRISGCSIRLKRPMNRVSRRRGMRLVSRKLRSSCCSILVISERTVMWPLPRCRKPRIMDIGHTTLALYAAGGAAVTASLVKLKTRLELSKAKHWSLTGHARMARRVAALILSYQFGEAEFFCCDGAPAEVAARRRAGFDRLSALYAQRFAATNRATAEVADSISDVQFTDAYRVPFQFSRYVREHLKTGSFLQSSSGVFVTDLDGNRFYDLTGSYGV